MPGKKLRKHLEDHYQLKIDSASPLSGGDINEVFLLRTPSQKLVLKVNDADKFPGMFQKEATGLMALKNTGAIDVPAVLGAGEYLGQSYLLQEYRESGRRDTNFNKIFAEQLAELHAQSQEKFGFVEDNYIGSLVQYNDEENSAADFYINQRLKPQFQLAAEKGYIFKDPESFYNQIRELIPDEKPALIHGDLWSGNCLINSKGYPVLIDPAVAYAPREMDLAMMHLFGRFDRELFDHYLRVFPVPSGWKERISLWQLYYILIHLNIFGSSYYASAKAIMAKYTTT